jgi:hypothetical protein
MGAEQILTAEKHNMDIPYRKINKVWMSKVGKMCSIHLITDNQHHDYDFPAVYQDKAQQLVKTFLSEKFTEPSIWD